MAEMLAGAILRSIGGFGLYQKFLCVCVVGAVSCLCALTFAAHLFSLMTPDHWCWDANLASLEGQLPLDQQDGKKFSLPEIKTSEFIIQYLCQFKGGALGEISNFYNFPPRLLNCVTHIPPIITMHASKFH